MDAYGYHALSCPDEGGLIKRHDHLCDYLYKLIIRGGFEAKQEQRYINVKGRRLRKNQRPGDILIYNWRYDDDSIGRLYVDLTVANIFCKSNLRDGCKKRALVAENYAVAKHNNYRNKDDIIGLGLEVLGGMSKNLKSLFGVIAEKLEARTDIARSVWINRIRSQFNGHLMLQNALMIQNSGMKISHRDYDIELGF